MIDYKARAKELANAHWSYIEGLLLAHYGSVTPDIEVARFHYLSAAEHFYKHAIEDIEAGYYAAN